MSSNIWSSINPNTTSGSQLAGLLNEFKDALMSGLSGTVRPAQLQAGGVWIDTSIQVAPNYTWIFKFWTGSIDVEIFRINILNGFGGALTAKDSFDSQSLSDDNVGALVELIKQRLNTNGQVLSGDTIAKIQFQGKDDQSGTDPLTVAYMQWTAQENETSSASGGQFSFFSRSVGSSFIAEHLRTLQDYVEFPVPFLVRAMQYVQDPIATAASITLLDSLNAIVEMTGSTATQIKGIDSAGETKEMTIHNRSSVNVTLKNQSTDALAANRILLPLGVDYVIAPNKSCILYYSDADTRWKMKASLNPAATTYSKTVRWPTGKWTSPSDAPSRINVTTYAKKNKVIPCYEDGNFPICLNYGGLSYAWGAPVTAGGTNAATSSPVIVLGGFNFKYLFPTSSTATFAVDYNGRAYAWGNLSAGAGGQGAQLMASSPVAVLGGFSFSKIKGAGESVFGLTQSGKMYFWGKNTFAVSGTTQHTGFSSPVAVTAIPVGIAIDDFVISKQSAGFGGAFSYDCWATSKDGRAYWFNNLDVTSLLIEGVDPDLTGRRLKIEKMNMYDAYESIIALDANGNLYAYGSDGSTGEVFGTVPNTNYNSFTLIQAGLGPIEDMWPSGSQGNPGTLVKTKAGDWYGWGFTSHGGESTIPLAPINLTWSTPTLIVGLAAFNFKKIIGMSGNTDTKYAIDKNGDVYMWGFHPITGVNVSSPVAVASALNIVDVYLAAGGQAAFLQSSDGRLYAWGSNLYLGNGDINTVFSSPVLVMGAAAFDVDWDVKTFSFDGISPSTDYYAHLNKFDSYFNGHHIGEYVEKIVIEYNLGGS